MAKLMKKNKPAKKTKLVKKKTAPRTKRSAAPKSGMSGYLVVWRHTMDDVPVGLFADDREAMQFAKKCSFSKGYDIADRLGIDCSTPVCFAVVRFEAGKTVDILVVNRLDDA